MYFTYVCMRGIDPKIRLLDNWRQLRCSLQQMNGQLSIILHSQVDIAVLRLSQDTMEAVSIAKQGS